MLRPAESREKETENAVISQTSRNMPGRFGKMNDENKKGFGLNQNPSFLFLFPSLALPRSGIMGIFSDYYEPPQKRFDKQSSKNVPTRVAVNN